MIVYLRPVDLPVYAMKHFGYSVSISTITRWRKQHPLPGLVTAEVFEVWFKARMEEKARRT